MKEGPENQDVPEEDNEQQPGPSSTLHLLSREELDQLSTLQILDLISSRLRHEPHVLMDLVYLRDRITDLEEINDQAMNAIQQLDEAVDKLKSPAFRVGTFLRIIQQTRALVCLNGTDYVCEINPDIPLASLQSGQRILCNEAYAVTHTIGFDKTGPIAKIDELLSGGRLRISQEAGVGGQVVERSELLAKDKLKNGMEVRLDANQRLAIEIISSSGKRIERSLQTVPDLPWASIGGQDDAVKAIRDTIEMPMVHKDLYERFEHHVPKGFLLYGPPGCGKTLLGKATASNLRKQILEHTGVDHPEYFHHVKGPELLNMWVGESERQVRDLFSQCRERAEEGQLAFLFIDEAESLLGTRHGGRIHSMSSTLVPMFCTEMDGIEALQNVVVILASNRADLIDPAILRPGRIDRKIKVRRPDKEGARRIYEIYLKETLPLDGTPAELAEAVTEKHFAHDDHNRFLQVTYRSGRTDTLYRGDLASGAIIEAIVERAKELAIQRAVLTSKDTFITRSDLLNAMETEHRENELFPTSDTTEDWLKLTDFDPQNVVKLGLANSHREDTKGSSNII